MSSMSFLCPFNALNNSVFVLFFLIIIIVTDVQQILELSNSGSLPSKTGGIPMIIMQIVA
jgi:hypothetical protein